VNGLSDKLTDPIASGSHTVRPWFSPSDSYLQIQPIAVKDLVCGSAVTVRVLYVGKDLGNSQSAQFHYQVIF